MGLFPHPISRCQALEWVPWLTWLLNPASATKDNSCVEVCPVDCIHPTPDEPDYDTQEQLFIDPTECIDCDACVEACPVDAIFPEDQVPAEWMKFTELNARYFDRSK
jgi:ferredoxin